MMKTLLKNQWRILLNTIRTQPAKNVFVFVLSLVIVGVFLYFFSATVWRIAPFLDAVTVERTAAYGFLIVIGLTILFGIPHVFKYLYSGSDLEMLFAMPIPTRNIFWMKYIQNYAGVPLMAFIFLAAPLLTYGIRTKASITFYFIALLSLFAITIIGLSVAYLINLVIIQIIPPSRANELMTVIGFLAGIIFYLLFMLPNLVADDLSTEDMVAILPPLPEWTPMSWAGKSMIASAEGSFAWFVPFILLIVVTIMIMIFSTSLVEKGFRTGYIRLSEGSPKKRKKRKQRKRKATPHSPITALGKKEWFAVKRDLREWLAFLPVVFFFAFGVIGYVSAGGSLSDLRADAVITWPIVQALLLFISTLACGTMTAATIGREGDSLWLIQVLPLNGRQIALGKLWISWLIYFILIVLIEIIAFIFFKWSILQLIYALLIQGAVSLGISALGLWVGTWGGKYHPENPQARLNFGASFLLFILSYLYLAIISLPLIYLFLPVDQFTIPEIEITGFGTFLAFVVFTLFKLKISQPLFMNLVGIFVFILFSGGITLLWVYLSARQIDKGLTINRVDETTSKPLFGRRGSGQSLY